MRSYFSDIGMPHINYDFFDLLPLGGKIAYEQQVRREA
jgi:hypothetical protein